MTEATTIVRIEVIRNKTPTGRPSATVARKLAQSFAFGPDPQPPPASTAQRGVWYGESGETFTHETVLEWVTREAKAKAFTYQFILSVKYVHLSPEEYCQAIRASGDLFPVWRLVAHQDTTYSHAHALAFGDKEIHIKSASFREWWQKVRAELERLQGLYLTDEIIQQRALATQEEKRRRAGLR
ncbi:MAG: hypothetical protein L0332_24095 [Chloroflexi bacterium]|nr:hypothetical protein [Chloroflexota bacterium]MCI0645175.1 hypothetical protein [Chloroflexota bacterium]MCI0729776.1 hypothetical protein [Chloroflexota bacterium]